MMACRGLYVFSHKSELGNAPAHKLFERIDAYLNDGVNVPRSFRDYTVNVDEQDLPVGVVLSRLLE
jgi:CRISPR-associated protein Csd2